jgi:S1-C subfamily serine protease
MFWSRFAVTFNFPARKLYLRETARLSLPDRWNATGLHLVKKGDLTEVDSVDADSPAAEAGLKKGDILVELNGLNAREVGLFRLYSELYVEGELKCVVRRHGKARWLSTRPRRQGQ